jgi:hypothetical protein
MTRTCHWYAYSWYVDECRRYKYGMFHSCYSTAEQRFSSNTMYRRSTTYWMSTRHDACQNCYIRNTHLRNRSQTAVASTANSIDTHNNRISAKIVRNRLHEDGLHGRRQYVGCVLRHTHNWLRQNWASWSFQFIELMSGFEYTVGEMNFLPTAAHLNEIVLGLGVLSLSGQALHISYLLHLPRRYRRAFECPTLPRWHFCKECYTNVSK